MERSRQRFLVGLQLRGPPPTFAMIGLRQIRQLKVNGERLVTRFAVSVSRAATSSLALAIRGAPLPSISLLAMFNQLPAQRFHGFEEPGAALLNQDFPSRIPRERIARFSGSSFRLSRVSAVNSPSRSLCLLSHGKALRRLAQYSRLARAFAYEDVY